MKNVLLSTAAVAGLALAAISPAAAQDGGLKLGVSGYAAGYAVYTDEDGTNLRTFDLRKSTEVALTGETTLENGLTVGAYINMLSDRFDNSNVEQSYLYMSSGWGRVNLGETDGVAALLQVAAPSADDFVDGIDPDINTLTTGSGFTPGYKQAFGNAFVNKLTYMTPVFNGFQAGVSYAPSVGEADKDGLAGVTATNTASEQENGWELGARYQGSFEAFDLTLGAGYSKSSAEVATVSYDDQKIWNVGGVVTVGGFDIGAAYKNDSTTAAGDFDNKVMVIGADYNVDAYKLGVSYQDYTAEQGTGVTDLEAQRYTGGVTYTYGPGMSFRGSVSYVDRDNGAAADTDGTQVAVGTVVNF